MRRFADKLLYGNVHVCSTTNTPSIALYGSTIPELPYKKILLLMAAFTAWLMISYVCGGMKVPLDDYTIERILFSRDMLIFLLLGLMIRDEKFLTGILTALALSLMIDNLFIFRHAAQGVERPYRTRAQRLLAVLGTDGLAGARICSAHCSDTYSVGRVGGRKIFTG